MIQGVRKVTARSGVAATCAKTHSLPTTRRVRRLSWRDIRSRSGIVSRDDAKSGQRRDGPVVSAVRRASGVALVCDAESERGATGTSVHSPAIAAPKKATAINERSGKSSYSVAKQRTDEVIGMMVSPVFACRRKPLARQSSVIRSVKWRENPPKALRRPSNQPLRFGPCETPKARQLAGL
jgi:hypothetical protein